MRACEILMAVLHCTLYEGRSSSHLTYTSTDFGVLKMGNDGVSKVISVVDVSLQTNTEVQLLLRGVKHTLYVRFNLIFVFFLDESLSQSLWFW